MKNHRVTLIADKCLDVFSFDENGCNEWGKNTLSQWLETEFRNEAFTKEEQKRLVDGLPITILPKHGVEAFFRKKKDRLCEYTEYAKEKYRESIENKIKGQDISWWTKTENGKENVFWVCNNGEIDGNGQPRRLAGVRPVIFLKIN